MLMIHVRELNHLCVEPSDMSKYTIHAGPRQEKIVSSPKYQAQWYITIPSVTESKQWGRVTLPRCWIKKCVTKITEQRAQAGESNYLNEGLRDMLQWPLWVGLRRNRRVTLSRCWVKLYDTITQFDRPRQKKRITSRKCWAKWCVTILIMDSSQEEKESHIT